MAIFITPDLPDEFFERLGRAFDMAAIDETWGAGLESVINDEGCILSPPEDSPGSVPDDDDRARIAACAPEALRMLLDLMAKREWSCSWCGSEVNDTPTARQVHLKGCEWDALMKKAGLR